MPAVISSIVRAYSNSILHILYCPLFAVSVSDCPALTIENGVVSSPDTSDGTTVTIECNAGFPPYTLSGPSSLTCNNGSWSDDAPVCLAGICICF